MNPINSRYKLIIYDCDGVMLDTLDSNYIFYNSVMEYLGRPQSGQVRPGRPETSCTPIRLTMSWSIFLPGMIVVMTPGPLPKPFITRIWPPS